MRASTRNSHHPISQLGSASPYMAPLRHAHPPSRPPVSVPDHIGLEAIERRGRLSGSIVISSSPLNRDRAKRRRRAALAFPSPMDWVRNMKVWFPSHSDATAYYGFHMLTRKVFLTISYDAVCCYKFACHGKRQTRRAAAGSVSSDARATRRGTAANPRFAPDVRGGIR